MYNTNVKPLISIVILNFNGIEYLKQTLPQLLKINYQNFEILVIDNCSTDDSVYFIQENFKTIKIFKNSENKGYSEGKNMGVSKALGQYILLLDDDILINDVTILDELLGAYLSKPDVFSISLLLVDAGLSSTQYYGGYYSYYGLMHRRSIDVGVITKTKDSLVLIGSPDGGALFFSKNDFIISGGYDIAQPYFCDVGDLGIRATILTNKKNYLYPKVALIHLGVFRKTDNKIWCWKFRYVFSGMSRIMFKNYKLLNLLVYYPLFLIFMLFKTFKQCISRKSLCVIWSLLLSIKLFVNDLVDILSERSLIQKNRQNKTDSFLYIRPKF